jgi:hypothetical protein
VKQVKAEIKKEEVQIIVTPENHAESSLKSTPVSNQQKPSLSFPSKPTKVTPPNEKQITGVSRKRPIRPQVSMISNQFKVEFDANKVTEIYLYSV